MYAPLIKCFLNYLTDLFMPFLQLNIVLVYFSVETKNNVQIILLSSNSIFNVYNCIIFMVKLVHKKQQSEETQTPQTFI